MNKIIELRDIRKNYENLEVLKSINIDIYEGEIVSIIGPSGSGKSTLLRCINMLEYPSSGDISIYGQNIFDKKININKIRQDVGMVFQSFNLFENMNVLENCMISQIKVLKRNKEEAKEIAIKYLTQVGLKNFIYYDTKQLSGGQKQRVAIARALCMEPKILLFDEPTSALDPQMVGEVLEVIKSLTKTNVTMIIVTHEMAFAKDVSNRTIFMDNGIVIEDGKTEEVFKNPKSEKTKEFIKRFLM